MVVEIIGLVLWTGIIGTFCFLSYRRKVSREAALHNIDINLQYLADKMRDIDDD